MTFARLATAALLLAGTATAEPVFSPGRIKADMTFLADDLLEGRGTGERGHEIAAKYVAAQLAVAGLKPGAKDGSWFQRVTLREMRRNGPPATLSISGPGGTSVWPSGEDVIVSAGETTPVADITAGAVFVGYGIDAPEYGFDDYAGLDVRGKIVVFLGGIPQGPPDETLAHIATRKAVMAAARGAIGMVGIGSREFRKRRPWKRMVASADEPRMTWVATDGAPHADSPGIRAAATLNDNAAAALLEGSPKTFEQVRDAAAPRGSHPKGFALATTLHLKAQSAYRTLTSPEVVGVIPGSDPRLKAETVVLMAHLDHLGIRPRDSGDRIYNGALDNAAGVAVMLEVARAVAAEPIKPKRTMMFVANTAEEKGLLGAEAFANDSSVPIADIVAVVDLDQPLLLYDFNDINAFGDQHSTLGPVVARAAAKAGVRLSPDPVPEETIFVRSDHYTFVKRGVPAILLATGHGGPGAAAWADFNKTRYHQPSDDLSQNIDWAAGAKYACVNYLIARDIADAAMRPRWYAGDYFGDTFAKDAPKAKRP